MLNREKFTALLEKYALDVISPEERSELMAGITSGLYDDLVLQHIENNLQTSNTNAEGANLPPHRSADILHKIFSSEKQNSLLIPKASTKVKVIGWAMAAAVAGVIAFSAYFFTNNENNDQVAGITFAGDMEEKINKSGQPLKIEMTIITTRH